MFIVSMFLGSQLLQTANQLGTWNPQQWRNQANPSKAFLICLPCFAILESDYHIRMQYPFARRWWKDHVTTEGHKTNCWRHKDNVSRQAEDKTPKPTVWQTLMLLLKKTKTIAGWGPSNYPSTSSLTTLDWSAVYNYTDLGVSGHVIFWEENLFSQIDFVNQPTNQQKHPQVSPLYCDKSIFYKKYWMPGLPQSIRRVLS